MSSQTVSTRQPYDWAATVIATQLSPSFATASFPCDRNDFVLAIDQMRVYLHNARRDALRKRSITDNSELHVVNLAIEEITGPQRRLAEECGVHTDNPCPSLLRQYLKHTKRLRRWVHRWPHMPITLPRKVRAELITFFEKIAALESFFRDETFDDMITHGNLLH